MKLTLIFLVFSFSTVAFAQDKVAEKSIQKFLSQFNHANYGEIYNTFSLEYQKNISKDELAKYLSNIHGMIDGFRSAKFKSQNKREFNYFFVCKDEEVNADFQCVIGLDGKFEYLSFKRIGGRGNPPAVDKMKQ